MKKIVIRVIAVVLMLSLFSVNAFAVDADSTADSDNTMAADNGVTMVSPDMRIDNQNIYEGMDKAYCDGYVPRVEKGYVYIVLPLLCDSKVKNDCVTVSLNLGEAGDSPFVCKNYEKNVYLSEMNINNNTGKMTCYPVVFSLELKPDRVNGSYPVMFSVKGRDEDNNDIYGDFTVYVSISDGKSAVAEEGTDEEGQPVFAPKLLVESYSFSKEDINAGDSVTVNIQMHNMSTTEGVKNTSITIEEPEENFSMADKSATIYVGDIAANQSVNVEYTYSISPDTPQGQYDFIVAADYADAKGNAYTSGGNVKMVVKQPVNVQFGEFSLGESLEVADVTTAMVQVMNLGRGKIYNVRAKIEGDGLIPEKTVFIGDVEAGQEALGEAAVTITGLSDSTIPYGDTTGKITYYYEDESGNQLQSQEEFTLKIKSPFSEDDNQPEDEPEQWWWIMAVVVGIMAVIVIIAVIRVIVRRKERYGMVQ